MKAVRVALMILLWGVPFGAWAEWGRTPDGAIRPPAGGQTLCADGQGGVWSGGWGTICHIDRDGNPTWDEVLSLREAHNLGGDTISYPADQFIAVNGRQALVGINEHIETTMYRGPHGPFPGLIDINAYIQLVSIDGEPLWREGGIQPIPTSESSYVLGVYPGPEDGTFLVHWSGWSGPMLQLVNNNGEFLWGDEGVSLDFRGNYGNYQFTDWNEGCFIVARNVTPSPTIAMVKFNADGDVVWERRLSGSPEGVTQSEMYDLESDREGGALLTYSYVREVILDGNIVKYVGINALRISGEGDSLWTRQVFERRVIADHYSLTHPIINYGGAREFFIAWNDGWPNPMGTVAIDINGEFLWEDPIEIVISEGIHDILRAVDSEEGVCYIWEHLDDRQRPRLQIWGQRISNDGERLWGDRGIPLISMGGPGEGELSNVVTDCNGGIIVTNFVHLQMINRNGEIGVVLPVGVEDDFSNDQTLPGAFSVELYPNPVNSHFRIVFDAAVSDYPISYNLFNVAGRSVVSGEILNAGSFDRDLSRLASGQYFLRLQSKKVSVTKGFRLVR